MRNWQGSRERAQNARTRCFWPRTGLDTQQARVHKQDRPSCVRDLTTQPLEGIRVGPSKAQV